MDDFKQKSKLSNRCDNSIKELSNTEKELQEKQKLLEAIFDVADVGICVTNDEGNFEIVNDAYCSMYGYNREELIGQSFGIVVPEEVREDALNLHKAFIQGQPEIGAEWKVIRKDGQLLDVFVTAGLLVQDDGRKLKVTTVTDMTTVKEAHKRLEMVFQVLSNAAEGVAFIDREPGRLIYVNDAFIKITGYNVQEINSMGMHNLFGFSEGNESFVNSILTKLEADGIWEGEIQLRTKDNRLLTLELVIKSIGDAAKTITNYAAIINDVTYRKKSEERIRYLTTYNSVTDLPNRLVLEETLEATIRNSPNGHLRLSVVIMDVDKFKGINDNYGFSTGDKVLRAVGQRIRGRLRGDYLLTYMGEDHFGILIHDVHSKEYALQLAQDIQSSFITPLNIDGYDISVTLSVGISIFPDESENSREIVRDAEKAVFEAKYKGRNRVEFFTRELNSKVSRRLQLKSDLKKCVKKNELFLVYQPQICLETGMVVGVEALLRWMHPIYGLVPPNEFIPIAEETGIIMEIGEWVIRTACLQAKEWQINNVAPFKVAVNLSSIQLRQNNIFHTIRNIIEEIGISPGTLELELTESSMMQDVDNCISVFNQLKEIGIKIAIDDFGTGYSSLSYLRKIPINKLKIDRSFIIDLGDNFESSIITKTIIDMARNLGFRVIAEGAETEKQIEYLKRSGCDEIQGYYYSKPLPAGEIKGFVEQKNSR